MKIDGQIEIFQKPKAPIWHLSLTYAWCECPKCKNQEGLCSRERDRCGGWYDIQADRCPKCGQPLTWDEKEIEKVAKKSRDYKECEELGLRGAVRKNKNGKWEEAPAPQNNRQQGVFVATE